MTEYKSSRDCNFVFAAKINIVDLEECIDWCEHILRKEAADPSYKSLMGYAYNFEMERQFAQSYIQQQRGAIKALEEPDKSTPDQRKIARQCIAMARSWGAVWEGGGTQRDMILSGKTDVAQLPPQEAVIGYYPYISPQSISTAVVPFDFSPEIHPFDDDR